MGSRGAGEHDVICESARHRLCDLAPTGVVRADECHDWLAHIPESPIIYQL